MEESVFMTQNLLVSHPTLQNPGHVFAYNTIHILKSKIYKRKVNLTCGRFVTSTNGFLKSLGKTSVGYTIRKENSKENVIIGIESKNSYTSLVLPP